MTSNRFEVEVNVYSVVSIAPADVARVTSAYLYGHTVVEVGFDLPSICDTKVTAVILKTTSTQVLNVEVGRNPDADAIGSIVNEARYLAQYQIDRFASGLHAGRVCGSLADATEYVSQLVS